MRQSVCVFKHSMHVHYFHLESFGNPKHFSILSSQNGATEEGGELPLPFRLKGNQALKKQLYLSLSAAPGQDDSITLTNTPLK